MCGEAIPPPDAALTPACEHSGQGDVQMGQYQNHYQVEYGACDTGYPSCLEGDIDQQTQCKLKRGGLRKTIYAILLLTVEWQLTEEMRKECLDLEMRMRIMLLYMMMPTKHIKTTAICKTEAFD